MTLDEAIEELGTLFVPRDGEQDRLADAQEMAIRSLEAWEKVKAEIASLKGDNFPNSYYIKIIEKHLQEVTTDEDCD